MGRFQLWGAGRSQTFAYLSHKSVDRAPRDRGSSYCSYGSECRWPAASFFPASRKGSPNKCIFCPPVDRDPSSTGRAFVSAPCDRYHPYRVAPFDFSNVRYRGLVAKTPPGVKGGGSNYSPRGARTTPSLFSAVMVKFLSKTSPTVRNNVDFSAVEDKFGVCCGAFCSPPSRLVDKYFIVSKSYADTKMFLVAPFFAPFAMVCERLYSARSNPNRSHGTGCERLYMLGAVRIVK